MASTVTKTTVQMKRAREELPDSSEDVSTAKKGRESEDRGTFLPKLETGILVADLQYKQTQHYEVLEYFKAKAVSHCFGLWMGQIITTKTKTKVGCKKEDERGNEKRGLRTTKVKSCTAL